MAWFCSLRATEHALCEQTRGNAAIGLFANFVSALAIRPKAGK